MLAGEAEFFSSEALEKVADDLMVNLIILQPGGNMVMKVNKSDNFLCIAHS